VPLARCAMVAVHPWDLMGASTAGMVTGWIDRTGAPWTACFPPPDVQGRDLADVCRALTALA
jgi:2-haloacid dehalogenase